jgi:hypothetical protein
MTQYCKTFSFVEEWIPRIWLTSCSAILGFEAELCQVLRSTLQCKTRIGRTIAGLLSLSFVVEEKKPE